MNLTPISYRFALFGLRRSGKSVFLAALNADRRPISDGSTISYVDTDPPYFPGLSEGESEVRRLRAKALFLENARGLGLGKVPAETETTEGVTTHSFNLTLAAQPAPGASQIIRIELLDYAGELLKPHSEEAEIRDLLHRALSETDGLVILAETPPSTPQSAGGVMAMQPLSELASALNTLHDQDPQALRCATLLVTKWDRCHPFDIVRSPGESERDFRARERAEESRHRALFEEWLEDAPEAGRLRELDRQLRASFAKADYSVWPTSAFGVSRLVQVNNGDGLPVEISASPELASLNLVEPLRFLIDRAREQHRRALEELAPDGTTASSDLPSDAAVVAEHGEDEALRAHALALREASATAEASARMSAAQSRARATKRKMVGILAGVAASCLLIGGGMYAKQAMNVSELRKSLEAALQSDDLARVIAAHDQILASADDRPAIGPVLSTPERDQLRLALAAQECELWGRRAGQDVLDTALARARQAILPKCDGLDHALAKETERAWRVEMDKAQDDLSAVASEGNCRSLRFDTAALEQTFDTLKEQLGKAPTTVDPSEVASRLVNGERQRAACLAWWTDAILTRDHEEAEGRLLEQQEWLKFFNRQVEFLGEAQDSDQPKRLKLVERSLRKLDERIRVRTEDSISKLSGSLNEMKDLKTAIDALKGRYAKELGGQLDILRKTIDIAISKLNEKVMCEAVGAIVGGYAKIQYDLAARNPKAVEELRKGVDGLKQYDPALHLVREVEENLKRGAATIYLKQVEVVGNVPFDDRADHKVQSLLTVGGLPGISLDWDDASKESGFVMSKLVASRWPEDDVDLQIALEQDTWGWNNEFFAGQRQLTRTDLFSSMTGGGLDLIAELKISIARDENAKNLNEVRPRSGSGNDIMVKFFLGSDRLPDLKENPCPAN